MRDPRLAIFITLMLTSVALAAVAVHTESSHLRADRLRLAEYDKLLAECEEFIPPDHYCELIARDRRRLPETQP